MKMSFKLAIFGCAIQISSAVIAVDIEIIDQKNANMNESSVRVATAKDLFEETYRRGGAEPKNLFNDCMNKVASRDARLFLATNHGKIIVSAFVLKEENTGMIRLEAVGFETTVSRDTIVLCMKKMIDAFADNTARGVSFYTEKRANLVDLYDWLAQGVGLCPRGSWYYDESGDKLAQYVQYGEWVDYYLNGATVFVVVPLCAPA